MFVLMLNTNLRLAELLPHLVLGHLELVDMIRILAETPEDNTKHVYPPLGGPKIYHPTTELHPDMYDKHYSSTTVPMHSFFVAVLLLRALGHLVGHVLFEVLLPGRPSRVGNIFVHIL